VKGSDMLEQRVDKNVCSKLGEIVAREGNIEDFAHKIINQYPSSLFPPK
jgi:hypothetical protein